MKPISALILGLALTALCSAPSVQAELRPEKIFVADTQKTNAYRKEGLITGGDRTIDQVVIKGIRRASNSGFERMVIDLEGMRDGKPSPLPRPPYFQLSVQPRRLVVSIWGNPQLSFADQKIQQIFSKSPWVQTFSLLPKLEDSVWTFSIEFKKPVQIEAFELKQPVRLIVDIMGEKTAATPSRSKKKSK